MSDIFPRAIFERIRAFLATKANGRIMLDVKDGRIVGAAIEERIRGDAPAPVEMPAVGPLKTRA